MVIVLEDQNLSSILRRDKPKKILWAVCLWGGSQEAILTLSVQNYPNPLFSKKWIKDFTNVQVS